MKKSYPVLMQEEAWDCGLACLVSCFWYYHIPVQKEEIYRQIHQKKNGVSLYDLVNVSRKFEMEAKGVKGDIHLLDKSHLPCIAHTIQEKKYYHYVVLYKIQKEKNQVYLFDPEIGFLTMTMKDFQAISTQIFLLIAPKKNREKKSIRKKDHRFFLYLKRIVVYYKKYILKHFFFSLFMLIVTFLCSYFLPILIQLKDDSFLLLVFTFFLFLFLLFLKVVFAHQKTKVAYFFRSKFQKQFRKEIFQQLFSLDFNKNKKILKNPYRLEEDIMQFEDIIFEILFQLSPNIILFIMISIFFSVYHLGYFILFMGLFLLLSLFAYSFRSSFFSFYHRLRKVRSFYRADFYSLFHGYASMKNLNLEDFMLQRIEKKEQNWLKEEKGMQYVFSKFQGYFSFLLDGCYFLFLLVGICLIRNEILNLSDFLLFSSFFSFLFQLLPAIFRLISRSLIYRNAILHILDLFLIQEPKKVFSNISVTSIHFCSITYFKNDRLLFDHLSISFSSGNWTLLYGKSGVGKSMLMSFLFENTHDYEGTILINDSLVSSVCPAHLRKEIIYVGQQEFLFDGTLMETFLPFTHSLDKMEKACLVAGISNLFLNGIIDWNFLILKNGNGLSDNEKSRLFLARALLRAKNMLILDETFNSLPAKEEEKILVKIKEYYPYLTLILISNYKRNEIYYSHIYQLEKGGILCVN